MSQREKRHQRRPKYFDEHKLDDNDNQVDEAHVQIGPDDIDSSVPQKVTKRATKRKSTTYHDSDDEDYSPKKSNYKDNSSDEDFKPASKKSKSSKAVPKYTQTAKRPIVVKGTEDWARKPLGLFTSAVHDERILSHAFLRRGMSIPPLIRLVRSVQSSKTISEKFSECNSL